jgi:WhiB family redox-sensing transcriptional regulator
MGDMQPGPVLREQQADQRWWHPALCVGRSALFFPPAGAEQEDARLAREQAAIELCVRCPIQVRCLDFAFRHDIRCGIWGGRTERDRAEVAVAPSGGQG